jgi:outer membrane lipoprotein-sorting protein
MLESRIFLVYYYVNNFIFDEGGEIMKLFLVLVMSLFAVGCASKDYVRQQIEPLQDKINKAQACCEQTQKAMKKSFELQQKK